LHLQVEVLMQDKIGIDTLIAIAQEELAKIEAKRE
jgi:hypothetical protein